MTYSSIPEWVKLVAVVLALVAVGFITYHLTTSSTGLDTSIQESAIKESDAKTKKLEKEAASLTKQLQELRAKPREIEYRYRTTKSKSDATVEIDSVINSLDFNGQAEFFAGEITGLNSIRRQYTGSNY